MRAFIIINFFFMAISSEAFAQRRGSQSQEKVRFEEIVDASTGQKKKKIRINLSGLDIPLQPNQYAQLWSQPLKPNPLAQANSLLALSNFIEIEGFRHANTKSDLSWSYLLYYSFLEAARDYLDSHGKVSLNLVPDLNMGIRIVKTYGILPETFYSGSAKDKTAPDYVQLRTELTNYLLKVKQTDAWLESTVLATVRSILNHHLGEPANRFLIGRNAYNPVEFLRSVLGFQVERYVMVSSDLSKPFWKRDYPVGNTTNPVYNIPLEFYTATLNNGIQTGYPSLHLADVFDIGFDAGPKIAIVPSFGLGQPPVDGLKRQYHFDYHSEGNLSPLLLFGYKIHQAQPWYLVRYFGSNPSANKDKEDAGTYVMSQDFLKINTWSFLIAKEALRDLEEDIK